MKQARMSVGSDEMGGPAVLEPDWMSTSSLNRWSVCHTRNRGGYFPLASPGNLQIDCPMHDGCVQCRRTLSREKSLQMAGCIALWVASEVAAWISGSGRE